MISCKACTDIFTPKTTRQIFCSRQCKTAHKDGVYNRRPIPCLMCGTLTKNAKFCNSTCFQEFSKENRQIKTYRCKSCNKKLIKNNKGQRCKSCYLSFVSVGNKTLGEVKYKKVDSNQFAKIRDNARKTYKKSNKSKQCILCSFPHHYEVAHIKDIASYSDDTFVRDINHIDNLIALCPNCHWCFDKDILDYRKNFQKK